MPEENSYDALVIGAGPGGYVCAIRCAQLGLKTAIVEKNPRLGGTCLNVGCIPSKALLHSTEIYHELLHGAKKHGITAKEVSMDISALMKKKDGVVDKLGKGVRMLVEKRGIEILTGTAKILGDGQVEVSGKEGMQTITAKEIILATGSKPVELPFMPYDGAGQGLRWGQRRCRCRRVLVGNMTTRWSRGRRRLRSWTPSRTRASGPRSTAIAPLRPWLITSHPGTIELRRPYPREIRLSREGCRGSVRSV